jgi:hypothetical protein
MTNPLAINYKRKKKKKKEITEMGDPGMHEKWQENEK